MGTVKKGIDILSVYANLYLLLLLTLIKNITERRIMRQQSKLDSKKVMVSMSTDLHKRVAETAKREHRTMQDQIRYMLDTHEDMKGE